MNPYYPMVVAATIVSLTYGCSTAPKTNANVSSAERAYEKAAAQSERLRAAPEAFQEAETALIAARNSLERAEEKAKVDHLAYLAKQRTAIAVARADKKLAQANIDQSGEKRLKVQLSAREQEAEDARIAAIALASEASAAQAERKNAELAADLARQEALNASRTATGAQQQAIGAQQQAIDASQAAANAQQETIGAQQQALRTQDQALATTQQRLDALATEVKDIRGIVTRSDDKGIVFTMQDVLFEFDSATLKPGGERALQQIAEALTSYPQASIVVEGYTDAVGDDTYNRQLSQNRAEAVRSALIRTGVSESKITARGLGEQFPVASNDTDAGRQHNRRVEIVVGADTITHSQAN